MKIFLPFVLILLVTSCVHHDKHTEKIVAKFDSVSKRLDSLNSTITISASNLYDSLYWKYNDDSISQLQNGVDRSLNYLKGLKARFRMACGDSTGNDLPERSYSDLSITNRFFFQNEGARELIPELSEIKRIFLIHAKDTLLKAAISKMTAIPDNQRDKDFMTVYFKNTPPVAALTILSKFENDIKTYEQKILREYLNN